MLQSVNRVVLFFYLKYGVSERSGRAVKSEPRSGSAADFLADCPQTNATLSDTFRRSPALHRRLVRCVAYIHTHGLGLKMHDKTTKIAGQDIEKTSSLLTDQCTTSSLLYSSSLLDYQAVADVFMRLCQV